MRTGALALMLLMASCGRPDSANLAAGPGNDSGLGLAGDQPEVAATVTIAASGPGGCSARWDGQPATPQQVLERSIALVERAITAVGGVQNITENAMPTIRVEAPAALGFACADTILSAIQRSGLISVLLQPAGAGDAALADFTLSDIAAPPPSVVIAVAGGGRLTWNREAIALDALAERVRQMSGGLAGAETPPGEVELRPAREANFGQVHEALRAVREGRVRAALLLPSVQPNPRPPMPVPAQPGPPPEVAATANEAEAAR